MTALISGRFLLPQAVAHTRKICKKDFCREFIGS